ncbi:hypothetical protein PVT68_07515 [Microbulbifer bruguierae]|uniref:Uncharacterized protein n=1 Tax=Microbulbifer bruguierae TaxID=3029061 RepID=A0ABY8NGS2_9GAMM|nr:hypothetical protein [Microbulbifer bruguierae]WGL18135.1 hypothetical protein PVT68_07515 [Microbulbifer bruguierae]
MGWSRVITCALLIGLCSAVVTAQQAAEDGQQQESVKESDEVTAKPVSVTDKQTSSEKPQKKIKAQSAESADSYEASEEISEDNTVSFPVDI